MARYYCSGFDIANAFGHGLGELFRQELKSTGRIVFIPGGAERVESEFYLIQDHMRESGEPMSV